jgi:phage anti-repressor protein/phage antirepressor YoqD-like protein
MKELIKISEREGKQVVSARELYIQLGYDISSFSKWATRNIIDNEFAIEGEDWTIVLNSDIDNQWINNPTKAPKDYAITVNMAKKLAMMSKTEMGNKIRDYFLECEKKAISGITLPNFNNPAEAARAWALEYEAKQQAQLEAKEAQDNVRRLVHDSKTYTAGEIAKEVGLRSAIELNNRLAKMEVQFKQNGTWLLYAKYADLGYTSVKQTVLDNGRIIYDRRWTGAGHDFIVSLFKEDE